LVWVRTERGVVKMAGEYSAYGQAMIGGRLVQVGDEWPFGVGGR
jgi:hypothetical protein